MLPTPEKPNPGAGPLANPDAIFALVADDPTVKEAAVRWDRAAASTQRDLVAPLDTQVRAGIPAANRAPLSSGEVDDYLVPIVMRMGRGDEPAVVANLRKAFRRLTLHTCSHDAARCLQEAAMAAEAEDRAPSPPPSRSCDRGCRTRIGRGPNFARRLWKRPRQHRGDIVCWLYVRRSG
jgi:hypothetical protein